VQLFVLEIYTIESRLIDSGDELFGRNNVYAVTGGNKRFFACVQIVDSVFFITVELEFPERVDANVLITDKERSHPI
jgi:hypothetical protein